MFLKNISQELLANLRKRVYFRNLTSQQFARLAEDMTYRKVKRGQVLFEQGEPVNQMYILVTGLVQLVELDIDGNEFYQIFGLKHLYPLGALAGRQTEFQTTGEALSDVEYITMSFDLYQEFVVSNEKVASDVMLELTSVMSEYKANWYDAMVYHTKDRILKCLTALVQEYGISEANGDMRLPFKTTFVDLANLCSTTRETVSRVVNELVADGICSYERKQLTIKKQQKVLLEVN